MEPLKIVRKKDLEIVEAIKSLAEYITYAEFCSLFPELEMTQTDWYTVSKFTCRTNKVQLEKKYMKDFEEDWNNRKYFAIKFFNKEKNLFIKNKGRNDDS